ncbi:MAG: HEAT repeat domain-containing protein [Gemmataceae bacterium]|nr:HEAT repeat domain-containing protein [Gemmataceae bacterium]
MSTPLLLEYFDRLPPLHPGDDEELWAAGAQQAIKGFRSAVRKKYTEGTLQRLLESGNPQVRRAAVLSLGLIGTMPSNAALAGRLDDDDPLVQRFAADALWEVWFRGGTPEQNWRLRQATRAADPAAGRAALDALVKAAPEYAEAYNQRAILFFKRGDYTKAVADCESVLRLNPHHFGAAAGLGQCYLKLKKPKAALRAFRQALAINPGLEHLHDTIRSLEEAIDRE